MDDERRSGLTSQLLVTLGYELTAPRTGWRRVRLYERALRRGEHFQAVILDATVRGGMEAWRQSSAFAPWIRK